MRKMNFKTRTLCVRLLLLLIFMLLFQSACNFFPSAPVCTATPALSAAQATLAPTTAPSLLPYIDLAGLEDVIRPIDAENKENEIIRNYFGALYSEATMKQTRVMEDIFILNDMSDFYGGILLDSSALVNEQFIKIAGIAIDAVDVCLDAGAVPLNKCCITIECPTKTKYREAVNTLIRENADIAFPARIVTSFKAIYSLDQVAMELGSTISASASGLTFCNGFDFSSSSMLTKNNIIVIVKQLFYDIDTDINPGTPIRGIFNSRYAPTYVSKQTIGRLMALAISSTNSYSTEKITNAISAAINSAFNADITVSAEQKSIINSILITSLIFGGNTNSAQTILGADALLNFVKAFRDNNNTIGGSQGLVVGFQGCSLKTGQKNVVSKFGEYTIVKPVTFNIQSKWGKITGGTTKYPYVDFYCSILSNFDGDLNQGLFTGWVALDVTDPHDRNVSLSIGVNGKTITIASAETIQAELTRGNDDITCDIRLNLFYDGVKIIDDQLGHIQWPDSSGSHQYLQNWNK